MLLKNETIDTKIYPVAFSYCVVDCNTAHKSYINNVFTKECMFCGHHCKSCNFALGCETCISADLELGWANAYIDPGASLFRRCQGNFIILY